MGLFNDNRELYELIIQLREEVRDLRGQVFALESKTRIIAAPNPSMFVGSLDFDVPINSVVNQLVKHLDLKVIKEFEYTMPQQVKLERVNEQTNSNS